MKEGIPKDGGVLSKAKAAATAGVTQAHCTKAKAARVRDAQSMRKVPGESASLTVSRLHTFQKSRVARRAPFENATVVVLKRLWYHMSTVPRNCDITRR